ncbi:hypothetical protein PIB30_018954 [Stylosanthes scabra]|uniref:Uncharacterized protein n=1 Tax=Stylosanthes scabra TaxID=79078 RepID=A0ABU6Z5M5_9FABA|nr:hypothetical protein [Stylosanthes scabra]
MLWFAILWTIWKCRNSSIVENKTIGWEEAWNQVNFSTQNWLITRKNDNRGLRREELSHVMPKPGWWHCYYFDLVKNIYVVGGYFTYEVGEIKVWMGEEVKVNSQEEAQLKGLEITTQFLLEELNVRNGNALLILECKNIGMD